MRPSESTTLKFRPGLSDKTFWRLCRANPLLRLERTAKGELVVMAPASPDGSLQNAGLSAQLWLWNQRAGLGFAFESSAGFTLPNDAIRSPDASWMTRERWISSPHDDGRPFPRIVPDFVVELRSKSDGLAPLRRKMREYIDQGVRLGWLIDPKNGTVEIYRPDRPVEILTHPETLSGEDILPGFTLDLKTILFD